MYNNIYKLLFLRFFAITIYINIAFATYCRINTPIFPIPAKVFNIKPKIILMGEK
jgi:hypothetical protein